MEDETITIVVMNHEQGEVKFKIKRNTPFIKVVNAYCKKLNVDRDTFQFIFNGVRVQDEETPLGLEMEDHAVVDVKVAAIGGNV